MLRRVVGKEEHSTSLTIDPDQDFNKFAFVFRRIDHKVGKSRCFGANSETSSKAEAPTDA